MYWNRYALVLCVFYTLFTSSQACENPFDLNDMIDQLHKNRLHESFIKNPEFTMLTEGIIAPEQIHPQYVSIVIEPMGESHGKCVANITSDDGEVRSTCPTEFVLNYDANRKPEYLMEVNCPCDHCLDFLNLNDVIIQTENTCEPVYYYVRALRRLGCTNGVYDYVEVFEKIRVACTCAHVQQSPSVENTTSGNNHPEI